jgi:hypothetical protein
MWVVISGKRTSPWRVSEKPPGMGRENLLIIIRFNFNAGGERGREGRDDSFTGRRKYVAQGVGDHGGLLIDDELEALGADELDEACGLLVVVVAVARHGGHRRRLSLAHHVVDLSAVAVLRAELDGGQRSQGLAGSRGRRGLSLVLEKRMDLEARPMGLSFVSFKPIHHLIQEEDGWAYGSMGRAVSLD